ncbi:MAG: hypothetical protein Q7K43_04950, partial [Candidatus Woesearchaeota archaeon]|nr:hypothetical protein [Candidatus Woesearchaeota archaeon]
KQKTKPVHAVHDALNKGGFDFIIMTMFPHDKKREQYHHEDAVYLHAGMGVCEPKEFLNGGMIDKHAPPNTSSQGYEERERDRELLLQPTFQNLSSAQYVSVALSWAVNHLTELYGPVAALWSEAEYFINRQKKGLPVCIPEINTQGIFSLSDAHPLIELERPVGISLDYDGDHPRVLLWGLHSGGKTIALQTIAHYHLAGLAGLCVPAQSAQIPVIKRLHHVFESDYSGSGGRLQQDQAYLARLSQQLAKGDLVCIDEFLQHASPDAAEALEAEILGEFERSGAVVALVSHRGNDQAGAWQVYSPQYSGQNGIITPTFGLQKGAPDSQVLERHALQMLEKAMVSIGENILPKKAEQ